MSASPAAKPSVNSAARTRRRYRAAGRARQKQETQLRILDSAITHFSQRGFEAASLREISADAGVTHAVIRLHFGSKERLWRAAVDRLFQRQQEELLADVEDGAGTDARHRARAVLQAYVRYCARHPEHVRIMVQESLHDSARLKWLAATHVAAVQAPFVRAFKTQRRADPRAAHAIPSVLYAAVAASQIVFALGAELRHVYGIDVTDPAFVNMHAGVVSRAFLSAEAMAVWSRAASASRVPRSPAPSSNPRRAKR